MKVYRRIRLIVIARYAPRRIIRIGRGSSIRTALHIPNASIAGRIIMRRRTAPLGGRMIIIKSIMRFYVMDRENNLKFGHHLKSEAYEEAP